MRDGGSTPSVLSAPRQHSDLRGTETEPHSLATGPLRAPRRRRKAAWLGGGPAAVPRSGEEPARPSRGSPGMVSGLCPLERVHAAAPGLSGYGSRPCALLSERARPRRGSPGMAPGLCSLERVHAAEPVVCDICRLTSEAAERPGKGHRAPLSTHGGRAGMQNAPRRIGRPVMTARSVRAGAFCGGRRLRGSLQHQVLRRQAWTGRKRSGQVADTTGPPSVRVLTVCAWRGCTRPCTALCGTPGCAVCPPDPRRGCTRACVR